MKKMLNKIVLFKWPAISLFLFVSFNIAAEKPLFEWKFNQLSALNGLPNNDVQKVYQDRDGYLWMATRNGLSQYDGYTMRTYKSDLYNQDLLSENNILCIAEDYDKHLWISTNNGLNVLDKLSGKISQIQQDPLKNNSIPVIFVTKKGKILLGTDSGLYQYIYETDSCILYDKRNTGGVLPQTPIKSLMEDSRGDLWIGTWSEGLYRWDTEKNKYYAYPRMNPRNSAHVVFEDSRKRIWVGTWESGLYLLNNAYDAPLTTWTVFQNNKTNPNSLSDDIVYSISEDLNTHTLWVGTRSGLSILPLNGSKAFFNFYPNGKDNSISGNEVNSILRDNQGIMWLGMIGGGVNSVITRKPDFNLDRLESLKNKLTSNSVRSLLVDADKKIWLGIGTYGLAFQDRETDDATHYSDISDFNSLEKIPTVLTMMQSPTTGKIWIGTYDGGVYVYDKKAKKGMRATSLLSENTAWLPGFRVYAIQEDSQQNVWFGTDAGLSLLKPNGEGIRFDSLKIGGKAMNSIIVTAFEEENTGSRWLASENNGIIRITGSQPDNYQFENYSPNNQKLNSINALCLYKDTRNRIWAGTEGGGLNLYDGEKNTFIPVHKQWYLPGDAIYSILEDSHENLWMGTNAGLLKLHTPEDLSQVSYRLYTTSDGLQDNIFNRNCAFKKSDGEMFFGGHQGYNYFYPEKIAEQNSCSPIVITDIKIFNQSWSSLEEKTKNKISKQTPNYTKQVVLNYLQNNFNIEFALLGYVEPNQHKYAFKLDGFDPDWIYSDASRRFAYYNNLRPGTYIFRLKAANANGIWAEREFPLQIVIQSPPWKTAWAYLIYFVIAGFIVFFLYRMARNRIHLRNALHLRELERLKAEELNHAKLQFFTNITHELLTPLTIISATVDELKMTAPGNQENYQVMTNNINRLIRLLQQILEFRKAETGNLKLRVSKGDLAAFAQNSVDSFRPLMKKKRIHFSIICNPEPFPAYFDPDKMDKILYNLLSNAAKYNQPGSTVWIDLSKDKTGCYAIINIKDNGIGMSKEVLNSLFKRFYEGDYRKFNTIGTGIGLSLTKDLVELHGGIITVESEPDKGACFHLQIPVQREAFKENEIDDTLIIPAAPLSVKKETAPIGNEPQNNNKSHSLLLLEDNEELLSLMVRLLSMDYAVYTGQTGKEGVEIIEQENIDLIVSDIMMPEMDGIEFCKYVKSNLETSHIPLILLTAKNKEEDQVEAYDSGADAFISKPFSLSVLHSRISNLLKTRERVMRDFKKQLVFEAQELNYTSIDEEFLQKAIDFVHKHLDDSEFDQQKFMDEMGASQSTLYRKLKSLTGLNPSAFIRNIRLKAACQIMEQKTHIRISELAFAVGFNDPKYFSACFKKEFGMQPSEYMERFL